MKLRKLLFFTAGLIKKTGVRKWAACFVPAGTAAALVLAETAMYSLLLHFGGLRVHELFTGRNPCALAIMAAFTAMRWIVCAPLTVCAAGIALQLCRGEVPDSFGDWFFGKISLSRSIRAELLCRVISLAAAIPPAVCTFAGEGLLKTGGRTQAFMAMHALVLGAVLLVLWGILRLKLIAVPFLIAAEPERGAVSAVFRTLRLCRGKAGTLAGTFAASSLLCVPLIGAAAGIPLYFAGNAACIYIFIKEEEWLERNSFQGGTGKAHDPEVLPPGKKRRFAQADGAAETGGGRDHLQRQPHSQHRHCPGRRHHRAPGGGRQLS